MIKADVTSKHFFGQITETKNNEKKVKKIPKYIQKVKKY